MLREVARRLFPFSFVMRWCSQSSSTGQSSIPKVHYMKARASRNEHAGACCAVVNLQILNRSKEDRQLCPTCLGEIYKMLT